jgi:glutaconate CoA-transferase subunit A
MAPRLLGGALNWPFAAWPQSSPGMHDVDEQHMKLMNEALASEEGTAAYVRDFVESYRDIPNTV